MSEEAKNVSKTVNTIKCCAGCAQKLERIYDIVEREEDVPAGTCSLCLNYYQLGKYDIRRRQRQYRVRSGGGERARAGGGQHE